MINSNKLFFIVFFLSLMLFSLLHFFAGKSIADNSDYQGIMYGVDKLTPDTSGKNPIFQKKEIPIDEKDKTLKLNSFEKQSMKIESSQVQLDNTVSVENKIDNEFNNTSSLSGDNKTKIDSSTGIKPEKKKKSFKTFLYILGAALIVVLLV